MSLIICIYFITNLSMSAILAQIEMYPTGISVRQEFPAVKRLRATKIKCRVQYVSKRQYCDDVYDFFTHKQKKSVPSLLCTRLSVTYVAGKKARLLNPGQANLRPNLGGGCPPPRFSKVRVVGNRELIFRGCYFSNNYQTNIST